MENNKQLHTQGEWNWNGNPLNENEILITRGLNFIAIIQKKEVDSDKEAYENAQRIVTCVNAMQGLNNKQVAKLKEKIEKLENLVELLQDQIDDVKNDKWEDEQEDDL